MQVSALNLIIAAQQTRTAVPPQPAARKPAESVANPATTTALAAAGPADASTPSRPSAPAPLGSQIDIRV